MRLYYINLDRAEERRAHMEQALEGLDHERVAAVDGARRPPTGKNLTRFEIACVESHRAAWIRFLASPATFACFLEDDLHLSPQFPAFVAEDSWIPADAHAVKLDSFLNKIMLGAPLPAPLGRSLALLYTRHESSAAYILSRRGAETFLRQTEDPNLPLDYIVFPEDPIGRKLRLYQLSPAAAIQDSRYRDQNSRGQEFASAIGKKDSIKPAGGLPRLLFTLKRETLRIVRRGPKAGRHLVNRFVRGLKAEIVPFQ